LHVIALHGNKITNENHETMETEQIERVMVETIELQSQLLTRPVRIDFYQSGNDHSADPALLLMNDGQDLLKMDFEKLFEPFNSEKRIRPLLVAGIHCGEDRINEYGMSSGPDYMGRGTKAELYEEFIISELLPFIRGRFNQYDLREAAFAGFSLGALSALDIAWNNPEIFSRIGVFSGSLWWRSVSQADKDYNQSAHRIMHAQVRNSTFRPGMKFFFECGELDENMDRNKNGVIDSIDDTIDLMRELTRKGYREGKDFTYLQLPDGKHDVASWAKAIPAFLKWGWGLSVN
jgi:enterochelin esterase-like enzyme